MSSELQTTTDDTVTALASLLAKAGDAVIRNPEDARAYLRQASNLLRHQPRSLPQEARSGALAPWQVRRLREYAEANLDQSLHVAELAAVASRSPSSHFTRAFRISFGHSPHAYVVQQRVARAITMMRETTEPLAAIAIACGCSDQAHLCRLFREVVGCSPGKWRHQHVEPHRAPAHPADRKENACWK